MKESQPTFTKLKTLKHEELIQIIIQQQKKGLDWMDELAEEKEKNASLEKNVERLEVKLGNERSANKKLREENVELRITCDGLEEENKEICAYYGVEHKTSRSFKPRMTVIPQNEAKITDIHKDKPKPESNAQQVRDSG